MKWSIVGYTIALLAILGVISQGNRAHAQDTATGFVPITVENISQLELIYELQEGWCFDFSPDSTLIATRNGVYNLTNGEMVFEVDGLSGQFSPDGRFLYAEDSDIYDVATGEGIYWAYARLNEWQNADFSNENSIIINGDSTRVIDLISGESIFSVNAYTTPNRVDGDLSPDGRYVALDRGYGIYDINKGEKILDTPNVLSLDQVEFSPDGRFVAVCWYGIYALDVNLFERVVDDIACGFVKFSNNSQWLIVDEDVYDTNTWQIHSTLEEIPIVYAETLFSPSDTWIYHYNRVFDPDSGQTLFDAAAGVLFSPDDRLMVVGGEGFYNTNSWEMIYPIDFPTYPLPMFSPDGAFIAFSPTGQECAVYGIPNE